MKANWVGVGTLALILVGMELSCVNNDASVAIVFNVAPDTSCKWSVQTGTTYIFVPSGLLDLSTRDVYWFFPQIENNMPSNLITSSTGTSSESQLDTLAVQIEKAEVTYSWSPPGSSIIAADPILTSIEKQDPFIAPLSGVISSADTSGTPGMMVTSMPLFSSVVGDLFRTELTTDDMQIVSLEAHVTIYGHTLGGVSVKSNEFVYPVRFCLGCTVGLMCCPAATTPTAANFCISGQDSPQPCSC